MLTGCIYDDLPSASSSTGDAGKQGPPSAGMAAISLITSVASQGGEQANLETASTRAGTTIQSSQFDNGETFYAYFPADATINYVAAPVNTTYTTDGSGGATPAIQPYFSAGITSVTVHAYYPSSVTETTSSFSVASDQTGTTNYKASDLMYATCTATRSAGDFEGYGSLVFNHRMVKIIVLATANTSKGVNTITDVRIIGGHRTIDITTPLTCTLGTTLSDANSTGDYISVYTGGASATASCAALIVPETVTGQFLQVITDMGSAYYSLDGKVFASGSAYTFDITISAADINLTTEITNWGDGGTTTLVNNGTEALN